MTAITDLFFDETTGDVIDRETGEVVDQLFSSDVPYNIAGNYHELAPRNYKSLIERMDVKHVTWKMKRRSHLLKRLQRIYSEEDLPISVFHRFLDSVEHVSLAGKWLIKEFELFCRYSNIWVSSRFKGHLGIHSTSIPSIDTCISR